MVGDCTYIIRGKIDDGDGVLGVKEEVVALVAPPGRWLVRYNEPTQ